MYSNIPHEIILYILLLTNIKCHCCYKSLDTNFYKKEYNNYYCCIECYNFI